MSQNQPAIPDPYLPGSGTPDYTVEHYDLDLEVKLAANRVSGVARLEGTVLKATRRIELDLHGLSASKVKANSGARSVKVGRTAARKGRLVIDLGATLDDGAPLTLEVTYAGVPRMHRGAWGEIGWEELDDGVLVAGQPNGAATWFPCVDHPSVKSTYRIVITTDAGYLPVCNGVPTGHRRRSSRQEWSWELRQPAPSYLVTVQIGRYQLVAVPERGSGRHRAGGPVRRAVEGLLDTLVPGREESAGERRWSGRGSEDAGGEDIPVFVAASPALQLRAQDALAVQAEMMACFSWHFGPYPFNRYTAVVTDDDLEIPLEAASVSIFGANHLTGSWAAERLVAHELAHQWFGNALTLRQWKDIWLHEGFACYSEWLWGAESGRGTLRSYARTAWRGLGRKDQDLVVADPGPELMFDDRIYKRGALALYALHRDLGAEPFGALLRAWVAEHRHGSVDTGMFLEFADRFIAQSGADRDPGVSGFPAAGRAGAGRASTVLRPWLSQEELPAFPD